MSTSFQKSIGGVVGRRKFLTVLGASALTVLHKSAVAEEIQLAALIAQAPQAHALIPGLRAALTSLDAVRALKDYESTFTKIEQVGRQTITARMQLKVRHDPFSVYIKYLEPHAGREAIYVADRNKNQVVVHDTGLAALVGTLALDPISSTAMDENRYPITKAGMKNLIEAVMALWLDQAKQNAAGITVNHYPNSKIGDQSCHTLETVLAQPIGTNSYQTTRLYMDSATQLPIRVQQYAFPTRRGQKPALVEDYLYQNLRTNLSLTDLDFDPQNPRYGY